MKIICIGRNYADHINELKNNRPTEPVIFLKTDTSVILKNQPFFIPNFSNDIHHEVEVLIKIKKIGKHIDPKFSHKYYDEISLGIDFTARDIQQKLKDKGLPWEKAKGFDGAAVIGQWVEKSTLGNLSQLQFGLVKNGQWVQQASTALMLWSIDELIAHVSTYFTLKKGDIIFTGTPAGVSRVQEGDVLEGFIGTESFFKVNVQ